MKLRLVLLLAAMAAVAAVASLHFTVTNRFEKLLVQEIFGPQEWTLRPRGECASSARPNTVECQGMPSGHCETAALLATLGCVSGLFPFPFPVYAGLLIVVVVALQRVLSSMHTVPQVLVGSLLGLLYGLLYHKTSLLVSLCVPIVLVVTTVALITRRHERSAVPDWVPSEMLADMAAKRSQTPFFVRCMGYVNGIRLGSEYGALTWTDLEGLLARLCDAIPISFRVDLVVGVKTGGAILAGYLSRHYDVPYAFVKLKRRREACDVLGGVRSLGDTVTEALAGNDGGFTICEAPAASDVRGRNVLLVDESVVSGGTLGAARAFLESSGAASVLVATVAVVASNVTSGVVDVSLTNSVYVWPWSFDN